MRRWDALAAAGLMVAAAPATAGVYADDLGKCVVARTTAADQQTFVKWMFSTMSANPAVQDMARVTDAQRDAYNLAAAKLVTRLLTVDCRPASLDALRYEGPLAIQVAFQALGQVAGRQLFNDPTVAGRMQSFVSGLNKADLDALLKEAGIPQPPAAPATKP